ncbi:MAG: KH domain-containing protein [Bradymonadia bacterium]
MSTPTHTIHLGNQHFTIENAEFVARATKAVLVRTTGVELLTVIDASPMTDKTLSQLSVDFRLRASVIGKIPSNFLKRETRPSEPEILMSRLIDRSVRPHYPNRLGVQTVISVMILSARPGVDLFQASMLGVSFALRDAQICDTIILGASFTDPDGSQLSIAVQRRGLVMAEGSFPEMLPDQVCEMLTARIDELKEYCEQLDTAEMNGTDSSNDSAGFDFEAVWASKDMNRRLALRRDIASVHDVCHDTVNKAWSEYIRSKAKVGSRLDGRAPDHIRHLNINAQMSETAHGAVQFSRGATCALVFATLGSTRELQDVADFYYGMRRDRLIVQYNFHPFSTNLGLLGRHMPNRREIGHGNLIKNALRPLMPSKDNFPFAIRLTSEIMSADGSSSMASVMGASLALAQAGIPFSKPVAGVSVGLFGTVQTPILFTDLTEDEDHASQFDLKVAGTASGITALQLDIKAPHLDANVFVKAIKTAEVGIHALLEKITPIWHACTQDNLDLTRCSTTMLIRQNDVGRIIGGGGKNLKQLQKSSGCRVELTSQGLAVINGPDVNCVRHAVHLLYNQSKRFERGRLYLAHAESSQPAGTRITVDGQYGLIPDAAMNVVANTPFLVRFVEKREDSVLIFEQPENSNLKLEQAINASSA